MGLYDNLFDEKIKCAYCGSSMWDDAIEIQTKDLDDPTLNVYDVHYEDGTCCFKETYGVKVNHAKTDQSNIEAWVSCKSPVCKFIVRMQEFVNMGYISGFGRSYRVRYQVRDGIVVGSCEVIKKDPDVDFASLRDEFWDKLSKKNLENDFQKILDEVHGQFAIAVLMWHPPFEEK